MGRVYSRLSAAILSGILVLGALGVGGASIYAAPGEKGAGKKQEAEKKTETGEETGAESASGTEAEFEGGHLAASDSTNREEDTEEEENGKKVLPHGTADHLIKASELKLTPPADYKINKSMQADAKEGKYGKYFLKDDIQTVRIEVDENNLNYMFQNAADKPTVMTESVTIGDQKISYTGLKTKGSYTLQHAFTEGRGSDRFSFTINFGKFIKKAQYGEKQNFYGASKICFNNFFFDKSMMKEYFALKLFTEMGLPTPEYGLARVYFNGQYYGVYSMVEALDSPILERYWNVGHKKISPYLLKPERTSLLEWQLKGKEGDALLWEEDKDTYNDVKEMLPTVRTWVKKLNQLSEGKDYSGKKIDVNSEAYVKLLGEIMDVDEAVKYYAVHSFLCQMDSYFNGMKNYGLYVGEDGKSLLVPWDYDLAFGCFFPSEAESTANYDIDVMYRAPITDTVKKGAFDDLSKQYYEDYPLFNVIYQNKSLMDKYHSYMKDCSKIAALGGKTSAGKEYDPAFFDSFVQTLSDKVVKAAGEKVVEHAGYMNRINQPLDAASAYTNLSKIIAMRSLGVWMQTTGQEILVSGNGCSLSTLGNAIDGYCTGRGTLASIDAGTGIYVVGEYAASAAPGLTLKNIGPGDENYQKIVEAVGCEADDSMLIYAMKDTGTPMKGYMLNIPLQKAYKEAKGEVQFYSYEDGKAVRIDMEEKENFYSGKTDSISYIVILQKGGNKLVARAGDNVSISSGISRFQIRRGLWTAAGVLVAFGLVVLWKRKLG